jgi:hypothetical protein
MGNTERFSRNRMGLRLKIAVFRCRYDKLGDRRAHRIKDIKLAMAWREAGKGR